MMEEPQLSDDQTIDISQLRMQVDLVKSTKMLKQKRQTDLHNQEETSGNLTDLKKYRGRPDSSISRAVKIEPRTSFEMSDIEVSESEFEFTKDDFNISDSEWSDEDEKQLIKLRLKRDTSSDDDGDIPLIHYLDRQRQTSNSVNTQLEGRVSKTYSEHDFVPKAPPSEILPNLQAEDTSNERTVSHDVREIPHSLGSSLETVASENNMPSENNMRFDEIGANEKIGLLEDLRDLGVTETSEEANGRLEIRKESQTSSSMGETIGALMGNSALGDTVEVLQPQISLEDEPRVEILNENETLTIRENEAHIETRALEESVLSCESGSLCTTPVPTKESRKRKSRPETWDKNKKKKAVQAGEGYIARDGKIVKARTLQPGCGENCTKKCHSLFLPDERQDLFNKFWSLRDMAEKRLFIARYIVAMEKNTNQSNFSRRNRTLKWYLPKEESEEKIPVCKTFFLHTLNISERMVFTAIEKTSTEMFPKDNRGGCTKTATLEKEHVRNHIQSFPVVDSHYCRQTTKRQYLGAHLNVSLMHRLYSEKRYSEGGQPISLRTYSDIFSTEFNLGFHRPSKNQCDFCTRFNNSSNEDKLTMKEEIDKHLEDHKKVFQMKQDDKERSKSNTNFEAYAFDLEQILITPKSMASSSYYKRKLSTFNLSWYELGSANVVCNIWHEGQAGRGSNEIDSCVYRMLENASNRNVKSVHLFSDSFGGQNRNRYFVTMMWYAINNLSIDEIVHVFFVRGHSKNENDSVHAAIERASQRMNVYTTGQWAAVIRGAKHRKPQYVVNELGSSDFLDFKKVASTLVNFDLDVDRDKVKWLDIRRIKVVKEKPNCFFYSDDISDEYKEVNLLQRVRKSVVVDAKSIELSVLDEGKARGIDKDKKKDLMDMCDQHLIPSVHREFFENLKVKP